MRDAHMMKDCPTLHSSKRPTHGAHLPERHRFSAIWQTASFAPPWFSSINGRRSNSVLVATVAAILAIAATAYQAYAAHEISRSWIEFVRVRGYLASMSANDRSLPHADPEPLGRLPAAPLVETVADELQRVTTDAGASLVSILTNRQGATPLMLGRVQISVVIRGTYQRLKTVLAEVKDRYPVLLVEQLTMRRLALPNNLEARASLLLLARPLPATTSTDDTDRSRR